MCRREFGEWVCGLLLRVALEELAGMFVGVVDWIGLGDL